MVWAAEDAPGIHAEVPHVAAFPRLRVLPPHVPAVMERRSMHMAGRSPIPEKFPF